jgi:hypothetical protein
LRLVTKWEQQHRDIADKQSPIMVVLKNIVREQEQQIDEVRSFIEVTPLDGYRDDIEDERCVGRLLMTDLQRLRKTLVRFGLGVIGPTEEPQYFSESGPAATQ